MTSTNVEELRALFDLLMTHIDRCGYVAGVELDDLYWDIPASDRYDPYETPNQLNLGSLSDDMQGLRQMLSEERPIGYHLVWLSAVLRRIGEKALG